MRVPTKCLLAVAALATAGTVNAQQRSEDNGYENTPVYVRVDGLPTHVAKQIERAAAKGLDPLAKYVQRTKFIHQLDLVALLMTPEQARIASRDARVRLVRIASVQ
jgi:hypothetical protein